MELFSVIDVARKLRCSREWVYDLEARCGIVPVVAGSPPGRGRGRRYSRAQYEQMRQMRALMLAERAREAQEAAHTLEEVEREP